MKDALLATGAALIFAVLLSSPTFADTPNKNATDVRPFHSTQADSQPASMPAFNAY